MAAPQCMFNLNNLPASALVACAVLLLTDQIAYWSIRAPLSFTPYLLDTTVWRRLHRVVAAVRTAFGAYGPEQDDLLLLQCHVALSFLFAVALIRLANVWLARANWHKARAGSVEKAAR